VKEGPIGIILLAEGIGHATATTRNVRTRSRHDLVIRWRRAELTRP
jgi:hypothetical protein